MRDLSEIYIFETNSEPFENKNLTVECVLIPEM